ncbi:DUF547 domain-containing protein [Algibacter marinivivus]|uniref:DUF547 domain-containing protein n=1 Tax=Algibacter marinivivus TaxID=2100723 RepID=A0A2U2X6U7_9FLAO|nr:DUF547 domain-containing protein [Algibacter marinivivus]PWH83483.1 DUF547 domain-containing protein [Algibacter marinivivus]
MKYLQLLAILIFISSCCSTKRISESSSNKPKTEVVEITKDSIVAEIEDTITIIETDTTKVSEPNNKDVINTEEEEETSIIFNHNNWNNLLQKHVSNQGNVDYKGFRTDRKALLNYITSLSENLPTDTWTKNEKLAYWINAYNAMTVDLILRHYPIKSIKDIKKPWQQRHWKLGEKWYDLNEIEHKILRKMKEPRIHFAIVCASFSCPQLQNKAFTAEHLETQLTTATKAFINDPKRNYITPTKIELSKIFAWFDKDFLVNGTGSIIQYVNRYSNTKISQKMTKRFMDYNWDLNE